MANCGCINHVCEAHRLPASMYASLLIRNPTSLIIIVSGTRREVDPHFYFEDNTRV